jgi:hypothetical protein
VLTNCSRVNLDIYRSDCHCPLDQPPILTKEASCLTLVAYFLGGPGQQPLSLFKAEFYDWEDAPALESGNYWLSAYALGDGRQNARGYFANNFYCDRTCRINFDSGCIKGPPYDTSHWRKIVPPQDYAFVVAIHPPLDEQEPGGDNGSSRACAADLNGDNHVTLQDLFDYLAAFFAGCP